METISTIVQAGGDVNSASIQFGTPLCLAAIRRDLAAVTFLIEHNASVNKYCHMLGSVAHAACAGGDMAVIRALHAAGADWKFPARVCVSALCHLSLLVQSDRSLVSSFISTEERQIQSAGAIAVRFRHCEAVDFCLGLPKGLSVDETWQFISKSSAAYVRGQSERTTSRGPSMILLRLALYIADIHTVIALWRLISSLQSLGQPDRTAALGDSMSLLSLAMCTLDIRTAELLLDHGARDSLLDPLGRGALAQALDATCLQNTNTADLDSAVKLLVRHGVDINGLRSPNWQNRYAIKDIFATWERDYASGELLRCEAVLLCDPTEQAGTALMYIVSRGNKLESRAHCIEVLLNNGAKADVRDEMGTSALDLARICWSGEPRTEVERTLLRKED